MTSLLSAVISQVKQPNRWVLRLDLRTVSEALSEYRSKKRVPDSRYDWNHACDYTLWLYVWTSVYAKERSWYSRISTGAKCRFNVWKVNSRCSPGCGERGAGAVRLRRRRRSLSPKLQCYIHVHDYRRASDIADYTPHPHHSTQQQQQQRTRQYGLTDARIGATTTDCDWGPIRALHWSDDDIESTGKTHTDMLWPKLLWDNCSLSLCLSIIVVIVVYCARKIRTQWTIAYWASEQGYVMYI